MKERPILFSGPMVRAILEGRKTQTRRVVKPQPTPYGEASPYALATQREHIGKPWMPVGGVFQDRWECPFGQPGDRLWVRETWALLGWYCDHWEEEIPTGDCTMLKRFYRASEPLPEGDCLRWRPSIHMPRWASRLTLEITAVRVERLQDITQEDAKAEGVAITEYYAMSRHPYRSAFIDLWDSIYGNWNSNPYVWVVEFRKVEDKR